MKNNHKFVHLQCTFPKLTETNQLYVLGLVEGLRHAQGKVKPTIKMPGETTGAKSVFYSRSLERKNYP